MVRVITGQQNQTLEVESQFRSSNTNMIIGNERSKQAILAALADTELQKILDAAMFNSKSVNQIIRDTGIPHTTAYRKIKWLLDEGCLLLIKLISQKMVRNLVY